MNYKSQLIKAENYQKKLLQQQFILAQQIGTVKGFYIYYFDTLPNFKTQKQCFDNVNELFVQIFGEEKYTDYNSFRISLNYHLKNKK